MSSTQTVTIHSQHAVTNFRIHSISDRAQAIARLASILETSGTRMYDKWKDPLSFDLMEWGARALVLESVSDEEAVTNLDHLINKILVDFIQKTSLRTPILFVETGWTCEKLFVELTSLSFDSKPLTLVPHDFALDMINWVNSLTSAPVPVSPEPQYSEANMESIKRSFILAYKMKAQQAFAIQKMRRFTQSVQQESETLAFVRTVIEERVAEQMSRAMQQAEESRTELKKRIDQMEQTHQETIEVLQTRSDVLENELTSAESTVLKLKVESINQKNSIDSLNAAIAQKIQEVAALRYNAERDRGCLLL